VRIFIKKNTMKKYLLLLVAILFTSVVSAQKIDKYCEVTVLPKNGFTSKRIAKISFGNQKELFDLKDTTEFNSLKQVNSFTTETDVLNFMVKSGWTLVNIHAFGVYTVAELLYFKKAYDSSALNE
jgi:hypothetical protein